MADGAMPTKGKRNAEKKPHDRTKKQKKRGEPAERVPLEPATGKLGDIFEAMRNSTAISEAMKADSLDRVFAELANHCVEFRVSATDALPFPKHLAVYMTNGSDVPSSDRCNHRTHGFFLGTPVSDEVLPEFLKELVGRCPQLGTVGSATRTSVRTRCPPTCNSPKLWQRGNYRIARPPEDGLEHKPKSNCKHMSMSDVLRTVRALSSGRDAQTAVAMVGRTRAEWSHARDPAR